MTAIRIPNKTLILKHGVRYMIRVDMICITGMHRIQFFSLTLMVTAAMAQQGRGPQNPLMLQDTQTLPLWQGQAPGAQGTEDRDIPTITVYMPRNSRPGM